MTTKKRPAKKEKDTVSLFPVKIPSAKELDKLFMRKSPAVDKDTPPLFKIGDRVIPRSWIIRHPFFKKSEQAVITHVLKNPNGKNIYIVHGNHFQVGPEVETDQLLKERDILTFEEAKIFAFLNEIKRHKIVIFDCKLRLRECQKLEAFLRKKLGIKGKPKLPARLK